MSGQAILSQLQGLLTKLDILQGRIKSGYAMRGTTDPAILRQEKESSEALAKARTYDAKFLEEQSSYQKNPKQRVQTLQEFVLLFFYVSFAIFSIAITIAAFLEDGQNYTTAAKVFGLCIVLALAITAILIRVA
jgi:ABC-type transport system involved in cytochrome bd biosynthesis fused ATPase/permease subunit